MSIINRFSAITNGGIVMIGNTLGLSKTDNSNNAGTRSSIGAFISLDEKLCVPTYQNGTTLDYTLNGSFAPFNVPNNSKILYAELIWGGLYAGGSSDLSSVIDNAVQFVTPNGSYFVAPDVATARNFSINLDGNLFKIYNRSANVTHLIQNVNSGYFAVGQVPALIEAIDSLTCFTNHAGWTLVVAYENTQMSLKSLAIWCGAKLVSHTQSNVLVKLQGINIPNEILTAKLFLSAQEGDAGIVGDQVQFGQNIDLLYTLSGVNNTPNNFFASQINGYDGLLETGGSFGQNNANALTNENTLACRQGWDITAVDVGRYLVDSSTPILNFISSGDLYLPNAYAMEVDLLQVPISGYTIVKSVNKNNSNLGDILTYTNIITNKGKTSSPMFYNDIPLNTQFVINTLKVNGSTIHNVSPNQGVQLPLIATNQSVSVVFSVKIISSPSDNQISTQSFITDGNITQYSNTVKTNINQDSKIIPYTRCNH